MFRLPRFSGKWKITTENSVNKLKTPDCSGVLLQWEEQLFFNVIQCRFGKALDGFRALFQLGMFFFAEGRIQAVVNAAFADDAGHGHADVLYAFDFMVKGGYVQNGVFVTVNRLADAAQGTGNAERGGTFAVDNLIGGVADVVVDFVFNFFRQRAVEVF